MACEGRVSLGGPCASGGRCAEGLLCEYGRCRAQCTNANQCPSGAICIGDPGVCTLTTDTCDADCAEGLVCSGSVCAIPCSAVTGCRGGSICDDTDAVCVAATDVDAGTEDDATITEDAAELEDAGNDASTDAAVTRGELARSLCVGFAHACAIRGGRVYCWGAAYANQIGDAPTETSLDHEGTCGPYDCQDRPRDPVLRTDGAGTVPLEDVVSIACGRDTTCALVDDGSVDTGSVWCWGGTGEVLGHGGLGAHAGFVIREGATSLEVGRHHACARVGAGYQCWGTNGRTADVEDGRLGSDGPDTTTTRAAPRFDDALDLALGGHFTCRVGEEGVRCLGFNEAEVTGLGTRAPDPVGHLVSGVTSSIVDLSAGVAYACAIEDDDAHCWGSNDSGALASEPVPICFGEDGGGFCRPGAQPVERGFDVRAVDLRSLSRGQSLTVCAITAESRAICWGSNSHGQAGIDDPSWSDVRVLARFVSTARGVPLEGIRSIGCGAATCCADTVGGEVYCWGENDLGQHGNGSTDSVLVDAGPVGGDIVALPHPYASPVDFSEISP